MSLYSQMSTALSQQWDSPGSAKQTLPCGDRNGRKGQSRTGQCREIVCFLVMQTRIRSELYVCVCVSTRRSKHQWLQSGQHYWITFFHAINLRGGTSAPACLDVLGLCRLIWFTLSRVGGLECVSGCWDTRAAEHTWLLTEFSNRPGTADVKLACRVGWAGRTLYSFPLRAALSAPFSPL